MDDREYERLATDTFARVLDMFQDVEPEDVEVDAAGDVVRLELRDGKRIVLNTQRPVHQLWLAGGQSAWHFSFDAAAQRWLDDKGRGELFEILCSLIESSLGVRLQVPPIS